MSCKKIYNLKGANFLKITALIPTLNPPDKIIEITNGLISRGFERVIIVNDGSTAEGSENIFETLAGIEGCTVLNHDINMGKGRALKTAFDYFIKNDMGHAGVVTLDDDGQHTIDDAISCAKALESNPDALIIGARDFSPANKNVPIKSRLGNRITSKVFRFACGVNISDTQTGLRAVPASLMAPLMDVSGERFEYETNMLLFAIDEGIEIVETPISTIYIEDNKATHFNALRDSWKIYKLLMSHILLALVPFVVDIALFALIYAMFPSDSAVTRIFYGTLAARAVSLLIGAFTSKKRIFKNRETRRQTASRCCFIDIVQMFLSFGAVALISFAAPSGILLWKILADILLGIAAMSIEDRWAFSPSEDAPGILGVILRALAFVGVLIGALLILLVGACAITFRGPSEAARDLLVNTAMETSAMKFLPKLFFSQEEIDAIIFKNTYVPVNEITDDTPIVKPSQNDGFDLSAITVEDVKGDTFVGKMMIVNDPTRIFVHTVPVFDEYGEGTHLADMLTETGAVAGINGGAFADIGGQGKGGMPRGVVIQNGELKCDGYTQYPVVIGFDAGGKLIIGVMSGREAIEKGIKEAVSFGPALIINGNRVPISGSGGGLNPRTAIGQREDGSVLMLVIDGRQPHSLGASYSDIADVMEKYGAVNAANLDGGSSSMMYYKGEMLNSLSSVIGARKLPTAFLVR